MTKNIFFSFKKNAKYFFYLTIVMLIFSSKGVFAQCSLAVTCTKTNIACNGGTSNITATASNGTAPYTYSTDGVNYAATTVFPKPAGSYTVWAKDINNCSASTVVVITQPTALNMNTSQNNINCNGNTNGSITVAGTGGTSPYQYKLNNLVYSSLNLFIGLSANTYTISARDANNCVATKTVTVTQPAPLTAIVVGKNGCFGTIDASAYVFSSGGTAPYSINWAPVSSNSDTIYNLNDGTYTCTITDAHNCNTNSSVTIVKPTSALNATASITQNIPCNGGTAAVNISAAGGTTPYLGTGIMYNSVGTYTYTVTDANECIASTLLSITEPPSYSINATISPLISFLGDTVNFSVTAPYGGNAYSWNNGTQNLTSQNFAIYGVDSTYDGTYTVSVTDTFGCLKTTTASLIVKYPTVGVLLSPKVFLAGCYNSGNGLMHDSLRRKGILANNALTEPYSNAPYNTLFTHVNGGGGENILPALLSTTGNNAIVDWVFIQLRSKNNDSIVFATKSALLQRDGDVVSAVDGISPVNIITAPTDSYYVAIKHRNHLGVMTRNPIYLNDVITTTVDFTSFSIPLYRRSLASGTSNNFPYTASQDSCTRKIGSVRALYSGNSNLAGSSGSLVRYNGTGSDRITVLSALPGATLIVSGYKKEDINLDGDVKYNGTANDRLLILQNTGTTIGTVNQQLPTN